MPHLVGLTAAEIQALPTSGTAWDNLVAAADGAVSTTLSSTSANSPWLNTYYESADVAVRRKVAGQYLAAALVYVAGGATHTAATYRDAVEDALRFIIGTEIDTTSYSQDPVDHLLATMRQLSSWVMAADLIGMDDTLTGTRSGWTSDQFGTWLGTLRTKSIGTQGRFTTMYKTVWISASNWGGMAFAAYLSICAYLDDTVQLDWVRDNVAKGFTGEDVTAHPSWPAGEFSPTEEGFTATADFDSSYACNYNADYPTTGDTAWTPINPTACGLGMDGICVEDLSRSASAYPTYDSTGIGYTNEVLEGWIAGAIVLYSTGRDIFVYGSDALLRAMKWLDREAEINTYHLSNWQAHAINAYYGSSLPTVTSTWGQTYGFADWIYANGITGGGITSFNVESLGGDVRATWSPDSTGLTLRRERWVGTGTPS